MSLSTGYPVPNLPMLGKGAVLLDRFDLVTGLPTGFQHLGNCTEFTIEDKPDIAKLFSSMTHNVSMIATALKKREPMVTIKGTDFSSLHAAIFAASSGKTTLTPTATTFTGEVLVSAAQAPVAKGRYFRVLNMNVDNVGTPPVLTSNAITLVAGTDYVVADPVAGLIYFPLTSTIDGIHSVTVTYHTLVGSFDQVPGSTVPFVKGHLLFIPDPVDGQKVGADIWQVNLFANSKIGLVADDYGNWELEGNILDNTGGLVALPSYATPNDPYYQYNFF
jgi:hypothetical protein